MKTKGRKVLILGIGFIIAFALWTWLIQIIDVKPAGVNGTGIGFATINTWFHSVTGANMTLYTITDWLGLVPIFICMLFGGIGFIQLMKRKSLFKGDFDIIALGIYYVIVISGYLIFEMIPINYRPIIINGFQESSYPSSTTLLVLSVMPTLVFQANRRLKNSTIKRIIKIITAIFTIFMVVGRLVSGVHWLTDIIGSVFLSVGLFYIYKGITLWNLMKNCRN
jgi:undecaprenyl-diphosphatase